MKRALLAITAVFLSCTENREPESETQHKSNFEPHIEETHESLPVNDYSYVDLLFVPANIAPLVSGERFAFGYAEGIAGTVSLEVADTKHVLKSAISCSQGNEEFSIYELPEGNYEELNKSFNVNPPKIEETGEYLKKIDWLNTLPWRLLSRFTFYCEVFDTPRSYHIEIKPDGGQLTLEFFPIPADEREDGVFPPVR